jgi:hypothetical protein
VTSQVVFDAAVDFVKPEGFLMHNCEEFDNQTCT